MVAVVSVGAGRLEAWQVLRGWKMQPNVDISNSSRISASGEWHGAESTHILDERSMGQGRSEPDSIRFDATVRANNTAQAIHNCNMEGMEVSQQAVLETYDYIAGKITAKTLVGRMKALHGLE